MIYGSIIHSEFDHPQLPTLLQQTIPILINFLQPDQVAPVRHSSAWAIGRLFSGKFLLLLSFNINLSSLLSALANSLNDSNSKIQVQILNSISSFAESASENTELDNPILFQYIRPFLEKFFQMTSYNENPNLDPNIRHLIYDTMGAIIQSSRIENKPEMNLIFGEIMQRLQWALNSDHSLIPSLCSVLFSVLSHVDVEVLEPNIDTLTTMLLQASILENNQTARSEIVIAFSKFIDTSPLVLERHHTVLIPHVMRLFEEDYSSDLCGLIGDISRALKPEFAQSAVVLIPFLINKLREIPPSNK